LKVVRVNIELDIRYDLHNCEVISFDIYAKERFRIFLIYRPPDTSAEKTLSLCNHISPFFLPRNNIIIGDLNCPVINWQNSTCGSNRAQRHFFEFCLSKSLNQYVNFPTRVGTSQNILDIVLCDRNDTISNVVSRPPLLSSDHSSVEFTIDLQGKDHKLSERNTSNVYYNYRNTNFETINRFLCSFNWERQFSFFASIQSKYDHFIKILKELVIANTPVSEKSKKQNIPRKIRQLLSKKKLLYKNYHLSDQNKLEYKHVAKCLKEEMKKFRSKCEDKIINSSNNNDFYKYVKRTLKAKERIPPIKKGNGSFAFDDISKGCTFTELFQSAYEKDDASAINIPNPLGSTNCDVSFAPFLVHDYAAKLPGKFTTTPDDINQFVLKHCAVGIASPLSLLFTEIFNSADIPTQWKDAHIVPVFKKGDRHDANNYRPISITSAVSRLFEKMLAHNIGNKYLHKITPHQFGFIPKSSCNLALISSISQWESSLKNKLPVDVIYFDYRKAFDKCSHNKLVSKLQSFGFSPKLISFLRSFLTNRKSNVRVDQTVCPLPVEVHSGVLQGTVTGPLLFLVFINDISELFSNFSNISFGLYADDLKIFGSNPSDLQNCVDSVYQWSVKWKLPLATEKIMVLHLGVNNPRHKYQINNIAISPQTVVRDLGLFIDEKLSFENHIHRQVAKAHSVCNTILFCFHFNSIDKYFQLFMTYALPYLEYCSELFTPKFNSPLCKVLESPLRQFSASVFQRVGVSYTSYANRLELCNLKPLFYRRYIIDLILAFKIINGFAKLPNHNFMLSRSTRCPNRIIASRCIYKNENFYLNRIVKEWNKIALRTSHCHTIEQFRNFLNDAELLPISQCPNFML
jgi:hypothetical protein